MLSHEDRIKAALYAEWSVALERLFAVKFRLRKERAERVKRTKKREPHVGNKRPIYIDHLAHQDRCLDKLMHALGLSRQDVRGLDAALNQTPCPEWIERGKADANRRIKEDKQTGGCGCHLCGERAHDVRWMRGR